MPRRARTRNKTHTLPTLQSATCARLAPLWKEMTTTFYKPCLRRVPRYQSKLELRIAIMTRMGTGTSNGYTRNPKKAL